MTKRSGQTPESFRKSIRAGERPAVARVITLLESTLKDQAALGRTVLESLMPDTGGAIRLGITGPPGVGKSTFIETLGLQLIEDGHRVAVLAIDPTSPVSGGSILGDKTRMEILSRSPNAFIRPSPSGTSLGGVAQRTREAMLVCEAAGFDVVIVETVGIGQSQVAVAGMVDFFLLLLLPASGDELQGIKKGVVELADGLAVNKADGSTLEAAERTQLDYTRALQVIRPSKDGETIPVLTLSALEGRGIAEIWEAILSHRKSQQKTDELQNRRRRQALAWMWDLVEQGLRDAFLADSGVATELARLEADVEDLKTTPGAAARSLLARFRRD